MAKKRGKILDTAEAWENGDLGTDEDSARVSDLIDQDTIDEAVGLQAISIRMQKSVLRDLKAIAKMNNMGYQPLIKNLLQRFVVAEHKKFYNEQVSMKIERESAASSSVDEIEEKEQKRA